eukprot:UN03690
MENQIFLEKRHFLNGLRSLFGDFKSLTPQSGLRPSFHPNYKVFNYGIFKITCELFHNT